MNDIETFIANRAIVGKAVEVNKEETKRLLDAVLYLNNKVKQLEFEKKGLQGLIDGQAIITKELEEIKFALQVEEHDNEYNCAEKDKLKAENARLRAVLQGIANNCSNAPEVARRVLNEIHG